MQIEYMEWFTASERNAWGKEKFTSIDGALAIWKTDVVRSLLTVVKRVYISFNLLTNKSFPPVFSIAA